MNELLTKGIGHTEFKDSPVGWKVVTMNDSSVQVLDGDRGKEYPKEKDFFQYGYCLFLSAKNVTKNGFRFDECSFISKEKDEKLRKGRLSRGDIVITTRGTVGNMAYFDNSVLYGVVRINSGMAIIRNEGELLDRNYLFHLMRAPVVNEQLELLTFGSAQPQLTIGVINSLKLPVPPLPEQQKIASILTSVDEVIEKTQSQINKLQDLKKGTMNELLTKGIGHTEFKDSPVGKIPVEWRGECLQDVLLELVDCEHKTAPYVENSEYLVVRTSNVRDGRLQHQDMKFTTLEGYNEWTKRSVPIEKDILFTREAPAGESCLVPEGKKVCLGQRMVLLKTNSHTTDEKFLSWFLQSDFAKKIIYKLSIGTTVTRINIEDIYKVMTPVPPLPEQQKIASILSSMDSHIEEKQRKLEQTQSLKKSLMQDLLTGKVRVTVH